MKGTKCTLSQSKIKFLGHVLNLGGFQDDMNKVEDILKVPVANNVSQVRTFVLVWLGIIVSLFASVPSVWPSYTRLHVAAAAVVD